MSELTIKLIIILIPGALATLIFGKLILHREWSNFRFVLYSILFGVVSCLTLQFIINLINVIRVHDLADLTLWGNLNNSKSIPYKEVALASILSVFISFLISYIENKKIINIVASRLGVSRKVGEENLYSMFLNEDKVNYVYLRDIRNKLTYHGWVKSFSETDSLSEIRLCDVGVYNYSNSKYLYEMEEIYLSLNKQEIIIELQKIEEYE